MTTLVRFDPFEAKTCAQHEVSQLLGDNSRTGRATKPASTRTWTPLVDVFEDASEIVVHAELPGVRQEDMGIELTGETLTIKGERKFEETQRRDRSVRVERAYGQFQRSFTIGVPVQSDAVAATYKDGVLEVHLPKSEATKPKKVKVSAN